MDLNEARKRIPEIAGLNDEAALNVIHEVYYPTMDKAVLSERLGYKAPPPPVPERSTARAVGDLGLQFAGGAVSGVRMMTDLAGANNRASTGLRSAEDALRELQSAAAKADQAKIAQILQESQDKGFGDQVLAGIKAFGVAPGAMMAQALGTSVPTLATAAIPGVGPAAVAARLGAAGAIGAAQGAGNIKGVIYEDVKRTLTAEGKFTPEEIEARATEAQAYSGPNAGQIALGAGLGAVAGSTGMERAVSGLRNGVTQAAPGMVARMGMGAAAEAVPEMAQGGQEKFASNTALVNEGFDVNPMAGVVSGATMEGLAGGAMGAAAGIPRPSVVTPGDRIRATEAVPESGPMTRAANVATEMKAQQADAMGASLTGTDPAALMGRSTDPLAGQITADRQKADSAALSRNQFADRNAASLTGGGLDGPRSDPLANMLSDARTTDANQFSNIQQFAANRPPMLAGDAARILGEAKTRGLDFTVAPHPQGGFMVVPRNWVTPQLAAQTMVDLENTIVRMAEADAAPVVRAPRADTSAQDLNLNTDPVAAYVDNLRTVNTPAAKLYVRDFDAGRITPEDVQQRMAADRGKTPDERLAEAAAEGLKMNPKGDPFKTLMAAQRATKTTPGSVIQVEGGYAIRTRQEPTLDAQATPEADAVPVQAEAVDAAPNAGAAPGLAGPEVVAESEPQPALNPDQDWQAFPPDTQTLGLPRAEMPQVKAQHRGALTNYLNARGVAHESDEVDADTLKPTQAEFSLEKVKKARDFSDTDRSILVSADGYVVDGHHQWIARGSKGERVKVIRLNAPIADLLPMVREFPSSTVDEAPANVQDAQAPAAEGAIEAQAAPVETPAPAGSDGATADGVPAEAGAGDAQADGVKADVPETTFGNTEPFEQAGLKIKTQRIKSGDEVKTRWVVQSPENAERERKGERQIGGDRIVDTREQAIATADEEVKRAKNEVDRAAAIDARTKADKEKADAEAADLADIDGFQDDKAKLVRARAAKILNQRLRNNGKETSRRDLVRKRVADGATVQQAEEGRRLVNADDSYLGEDQITKTGMDYAEFLIAKRDAVGSTPDAAKKEQWLKNVASQQRIVAVGGATITGHANGRVTFAGDPGTSKAGRALRDTVAEAMKAGATAQEVAEAALVKKTFSLNDNKPAYIDPAQKAVRQEMAGEITREQLHQRFADLDMALGQVASVTNPIEWTKADDDAVQALRAQKQSPAPAPAPAEPAVESVVIKEGKGLIKGKFLAEVDGDGVPGGPWDTREQAILAGEAWKQKTIQNAKDTAAEKSRWEAIADKVRVGKELSTVEIESLGLKPGTSDVRWFFPIAARLFDITSRDIRPMVKDLIRDSFTDMGAKREFVPTRAALESIAGKLQGESASEPVAPLPPPERPDALTLTPKQYDEAMLKFIAADTGAQMAEVREMYDTEGGRASREQDWVSAVVKAAESGAVLSRAALDKLLEIRPNTKLPADALPEGYQRAEARKSEAEEKQARVDNRKAAKESVAADGEAQPKEAIADLGEKIGGARKDTAESTGTKRTSTKPKDERPAWARRFQISQIAEISGTPEAGRWVVRDTKNLNWMKQPKQVGGTYDTEQAANDSVALAALSLKHRAVPSSGGKYEIWREIANGKRVKVVDQQFDSRDAAMLYMVQNAVSIIETNTTFGEADLPVPDNKVRQGAKRREGDVAGEDFMREFGFRGVEFGNWNNQAERQNLMNEAYDGLMDLAEVLGVPPRALGLGGDLALAFGARGQGLSGARAHYEPGKVAMNLTKMNGAGALAHEWFHALDHYFARQDGKSSSAWVTDKDGTRSLKVDDNFSRDAASGGFLREGSGVRPEVREAYTNLLKSMVRKAEQYVEDSARADKFVGATREDVRKQLNDLRSELAEQKNVAYYKRNNKPATADQLAEFDAIAQQIIEGVALELDLRASKTASPRAMSGMRWTNDHLEKLSDLHKAVRGRSGFTAEKNGVLDRLRQYMNLYQSRLKMLSDAQSSTEKTKQVPTDFAMDAKSLDQGRGTDYWTTPHELAARAFQGFVEDKVAEMGGRSPFLNYGPENAVIITPWGFKRPYPAGAERKVINENFQKLLDTIQTRESDDGAVTMFQRIDSNAQAGDTPTDVQPDTRPEAPINIGLLGRDIATYVGMSRAEVDAIRPYDARVISGDAELREIAESFGSEVQGFGLRVDLEPAEKKRFGFFGGVRTSGVIFLRDTGGDRPHLAVLGHELAHEMRSKKPALYNKMVDAIQPYINIRRYETEFVNSVVARDVKNPDKKQEEFIGEVLSDGFMDKDFWRALGDANPSLLRQIGGMVLDLVDKVLAKVGYTKRTERYLKDYKAVMKIAGEVMAEYGVSKAATGGTVFQSIEPAAPGSPDATRSKIMDAVPQGVIDRLSDITTSQRGFNRWWHRTVGTQLHKAKTNKQFAPVYYAVQDFMKDVSRMATLAADQAPDLLPQVDSLGDIKKLLPVMGVAGNRKRKAELKQASEALFDGTLRYTRDENGKAVPATEDDAKGIIWTTDELKERGLSDSAIALYRQARLAINQSLDNLLAADVYRMITAAKPESLAASKPEYDAMMDRVRKAAASNNPRAALDEVRAGLIEQQDRAKASMKDLKGRNDGQPNENAMAEITRQAKTINGIEEIIEQVDGKIERIADLKASGYAPLMRFGQYTLDAVDASGTRVFFGMYESQMASNAAARKFREDGLTVRQGIQSQREFELLKGVSPETAMLFAEMMGLEKNDAMQAWLQNAVAEQSALKRHIRRKGVEGFENDASRVVAAFITSNSRAASRALHGMRIQNLVENVRDGDVKDEAIALTEYVNNPKEEAQAIRSLLFVNYIGGSIASSLVNLTQTMVQTFPYLSQYGGPAKAAKRLGGAMKVVLGKIEDPDLAAAVRKAEESGVIKPQEVFQLQAEASRTLGSDLRVRAGLAAWGSFFQMAEVFNRRVAFVAAFQTAKEQGIADPYAFAENAVDETQGVFNKGNRPDWARGAVGATLFTFKTFMIQYVEFLKRLPNRERALALGMLVLLSGIRGLPFAEDAEDLVDTVAQQLGYNFTTKEQMDRFLVATLGKGFADFVQNGASTIPGVPFDVSARLGMSDLLPGTALLKPSETRKEDQVLEAFGVAGGFVRDALKGEFRPIAIRNLAKGLEMYDRGIYTDTRGRTVMEVDGVDAVMKGIGLQPNNVAAESRAVRTQYEKRALFTSVKNDISEKMALGMFEQNQDKVKAAREKLDDWNEKNPEAKIVINSQAIRRRVVEMRKDRAERFLRSTPKELKASTREAVQ